MKMSYKAAFLVKKGKIEIREIPIPPIGERDVLVKNVAANLCPTDIRKYNAELNKRFLPLILGHEVSGRIENVGKKVEGLEEGDRVVVIPDIWCNRCKWCRIGRVELCENLIGVGASSGKIEDCVNLYRKEGIGGAFAQYLKMPQQSVLKIPRGIGYAEASIVEPLACVLHSQEDAEVGIRKNVLILGGGPIGNLHVQVAKALNASTIALIEPMEERRELALKAGANKVFDPNESDLTERVLELTNGGANIAIVTAGGEAQLGCVKQSMDMMAPNGVVEIFSSSHSSQEVMLNPDVIHYNELRITGTYGYWPKHLDIAIELLKRKKIDTSILRFPILPLDEINRAFKIYGKKGSMKVGISIP